MSNDNNQPATVTPATTAPTANKPKVARKPKAHKANKPKGTKKPSLAEGHLRKSKRTGPVAVVHDFMDENPKMRRCDAIRALEKKGVAFYTARTQFQVWFKERKEAAAKRGKGKKAKVAKVTSVTVAA